MHLALYAFMIGMLLGWFAVSAKGDPVAFYGLQLPLLIGRDKGLSRSPGDVHEATHRRLLPDRMLRRRCCTTTCCATTLGADAAGLR
jgi:hypothetical protein